MEGPGWRPRDLRTDLLDGPKHDWQAPKFSPPATAFAGIYTIVQFFVIVAVSFAVLFGKLPQAMTLLAASLLAFNFYVQGVWLEDRSIGLPLEWLRLVSSTVLLWYGALATSPLWSTSLAQGGSLVLLACAIALIWANSKGRVNLPDAPGLRPAHQPAGGSSAG